jgi:hypothetical protein
MFNLVEEFPSPRASHVLKLGAVSTVLVLIAIAGYILFNPLPRPPDGEVLDVKLYSPQSITPGPDGTVLMTSATDSARPLLVLTPVKIHNSGNTPLSIFDVSGVVSVGETELERAAIPPEDFQRVFQYFPDLISYQQPPILRHAVIQPGQTLEGLLIFNYPLTEQQWDQRNSFEVKASFDNGPDIVLAGADATDVAPRLDAQAQ